jgi:hypothetical protein
MVVEVPAEDGAPASQVGFPKFEDRIILVTAGNEQEATTKGEEFAADYGKTSSWVVLKIVDVQELLDAELRDGSEIYSAFIGREWADVLMKGAKRPVDEWQKQNPGKDFREATVQEVTDAWDNRAKET